MILNIGTDRWDADDQNDDGDAGDGGDQDDDGDLDDHDQDDVYIMMKCLSVCVSRKISTFLKGLSVCL